MIEIASFPRVLKQKQCKWIKAAAKYSIFCVQSTGYGEKVITNYGTHDEHIGEVLVMCPLNALLSEYINKFGSHCCNVRRYTSFCLVVGDFAL